VICLGLGVLMLSFVAYQLWGTSLYESHAQSRLHATLAAKLGKPLPTSIDPHSSAEAHRGLPPLQSVPAPSTSAPPLNAPVGLLSIPAIHLSDAIVEGVGTAQLEQGPGHYPGTPLPGQAGNAAIAGHRTTYAAPFYDLNDLRLGDPIYVLTAQGLFRYDVSRTSVVSPTEVSVLNTESSTPTLTLTTCNPRYSDTQRLVVVADFVGAPAATTAPLGTTRPKKVITFAPEGSQGAHSSEATATLGSATSGITPIILWGLGTVVACIVVVLLWRRVPRWTRWMVVLVGLPIVVLPLLACFQQVSEALPSSF
jgi:sortase A